MSEHYYTQTPTSRHDEKQLTIELDGITLKFDTDAGVFSRGELDAGTEVMIKSLPELRGDVLDMGCGWGALGLFVKARNPEMVLHCADINERCVELTGRNARQNGLECTVQQSDGFAGISGEFDSVMTNPPIRAGKKVIYAMFSDAHAHIKPGGALYIVIQTKQGADSAIKYLKGIYSEVKIIGRGGGFKVVAAVKGE